MGNQPSTEAKAEPDGEEGSFGPSPFGSRNSSPRPSPDIVFSSQVHATPMNRHIKPDQYLTAHRSRISALNNDILHTSPEIPEIKREIPESPEYKKQFETSTLGYRSSFKPEKNSSDSPYPPSSTFARLDPNATYTTRNDMDELPYLNEPPSSSTKAQKRRKRKERRRKLKQQLASPDLGNNQEEPNLSAHSDNGAIVDSTPSKSRSSKRRNSATPGSQSRKKKKQKYNQDKDNLENDTIPFSSLAESLYADRMKNGTLEADENDLQDDNAQELPSNESDQEPPLSHQSISASNMDVDPDAEPSVHSDPVSASEIKASIVEDGSLSHSGSQPNGFEKISDNNDISSEVAQSDDQDRMAIDRDDLSIDELEENKEDNGEEMEENKAEDEVEDEEEDEEEDKEEIIEENNEEDGEEDNGDNSEASNDGEQDENVPVRVDFSPKSSLAGANATDNNEYRPDDEDPSNEDPDDEELPESPQMDDLRPKQNSARKRVVKPTFYERLADESSNSTPAHALSSPVAGPSTSTGKKQAKISTMLKGKTEDSPKPKTPKTPSQKRGAPSKTPKLGPRGLLTGAFSDVELRDIAKAVERWRDDHDLTQTQVNTLIQGNPKEVRSHEFWASIVASCPNRPRQKLINQCRRKFHNFVARGTWTEEQQEELKRVWEEHGNKYALIGKIINRHPEDVRDRVRNYAVCGDNRRSHPWTLEEEEKLQAIIADALRVIREHRKEGRINLQEADEELIDWQRVSELMDRTRSRLQCIQKWKIMNRHGVERGSIDGEEVMSIEEVIQKARDEVNAMSNRERFGIIKAVDASDAKADSRIPWAKVRSTYLEERWTRPTIMLAWYRLRHSVPDWSIMSIPEIVIQLSKTYRDTRKLEFPSGRGYDMDTEYNDMERKVQKMLKVHRTPKTPNIVVKTDDEDSGDEGSSEEDEVNEDKMEDIQSDEDEEVNQEESGTSKNEQHYEEESEVDEASNDDESKDKEVSTKDGEDEESNASVDLGNNAEDKGVDRESSVDAPSISKFTPRRVRRRQKRYSSSAKSTRTQNLSQQRPRSTRKIIEESSQEDQDANNDEELSSDTNASSVESIPARL
ncbi:uncharacterized protein GGS22DRAFT_199026 [Annulohypoxylon maeteangense]|uniref:uncharacterized protein n=1 Tax=Annulohypoxylon maeteangense TaxID=1927788 RepID=UPI002008005A|nr:uncharacterized protein GGS22DRAFT_199026 [Annulohypoxylon maeteangense]KAI0886626.1 hypothetical protein GGS22DRAFT_199026 [Annulohypoxylon maeteangense]